jgi:hypothetical protein
MRKFTDKDIVAIAAALSTFTKYVNGKRVMTKICLPTVRRAVNAGLSLDEIFNKENYSRAGEISPMPSVDEYIETMIGRKITVKPFSEDEHLDEDYTCLSECFHDFFTEISPRGGRWNIPNAKANLQKAISLYGLQPLFSEELMRAVNEKYKSKSDNKEKTADKDEKSEENEEGITCFEYIAEILKHKDDYDIVTDPTQEQLDRAEENKTLIDNIEKAEEIEAPQVEKTEITDEDDEPDGPYASGKEVYQDKLHTETAYQPDDPDIYNDDEPGLIPGQEDTNAFITMIDSPREFKRQCVAKEVMNSELDEINELAQLTGQKRIEDIIIALTDGKFDIEKESLAAKQIHQYYNTDLMRSFIQCVTSQQYEINEDSAVKYDVLKDNWDLRDVATRKLHKLKQLIYTYALDDDDMMNAIKDLEDLYSEKENKEKTD